MSGWSQVAREWRREEQVRSLAAQDRAERQERARIEIQRRGDNKHTARFWKQQFQADEEEARINQARLQQELHEERMKQEEKVAEQKELAAREKMREEKLRQQVREQSVELRELRSKLRAAYVTKELAVQLAEKEAARLEQKVKEKRLHERQQAAWAEHDQQEKEEEKVRLMKQHAHLQGLKNQLVEIERSRQQAFRIFLLEKQALNEIVLRIQEEDQREVEACMVAKQKTKAEIEKFRAEQIAWREKEKLRLQLEDKRIIAYLEEQEIREKEKKEAEKHRAVHKSLLVEKLAQRVLIEQQEKEERERLLWELNAEEERIRAEKMARLELEQRIRQREQLRQTRLLEAQLRLAKLQQQQKQEEMFKQMELNRLAEESRIEQLSAARRRIKQAEHRREVSALLETRKKEREEAQRAVEKLHRDEKQQEQHRRAMIEEERLKILQEHATRLLGFLPRGLVSDTELALLAPHNDTRNISDILNRH